MGELADQPDEYFTQEYAVLFFAFATGDLQTHTRERREHRVFRVLLDMISGLEQRLVDGSEEDAVHVASLVCLPGVCLVPTYTDAVLRSKRASPMRELTTQRA
jgi:hypothetical protein